MNQKEYENLCPINSITKCPPYEQGMNYLLESRKLHLFNLVLEQQIQERKDEIKQIERKLAQPSKKQRRKANEISKIYKCNQCEKSYGSEASLNLHIKIKHAVSESESKTHVEQSCQI